MEAKLFVTSGNTNKGSVNLKLPATVGRSREASVTVAHPMISRKHCELIESDGLIWLRDLGSLNGTLLDGQKIKESPLRPNEEFTIGPLTFRVEYEFAGDLSALPAPTLAEEPPQGLPSVVGEQAAEPSAVPDFAAVDETPLVEAEAEAEIDEEEDVDPFDAAVMEATELVPDEPVAVELPTEANPAGAEAEPPAELEEEKVEGSPDDEPEVVFEMEPGDEPVEIFEAELGEGDEQEDVPAVATIDAMGQPPDLSFMDDEPAAEAAEESPLTEEDDDEFVAVEVVDEEEPEPTPPPGFAPAEPPETEAAASPEASPADSPEFPVPSESDEPEPQAADDADLNDFFKSLS